jgi:hypothetical protein
MAERQQLTRDEEWRFAEPALRWHGWGSPVGVGILIVCAGIAALLARLAITGL